MKTLRPFLLLFMSFLMQAMEPSQLVQQAKNELESKSDMVRKIVKTTARKSVYPNLLGQNGAMPVLSKAAILVEKEDIEAFLDDIPDEATQRMLAANFRSKTGFVTMKRRETSAHLNDKYKLDETRMTASELEDIQTVRSMSSDGESGTGCCSVT